MTNHLSPDEFAEALGINPATVYRWLRQKRVRGRRPGGPRGQWWIPATEVARLTGEPAPRAISEKEAASYLDTLMTELRTESEARPSPAGV
ncbi:DNA-binding protein [Limnoglobus roseus]|uniref:DNA-binding protein n=2 Tax=Limnoglobus roseus TaxID=2598579 RepID=A0A5C1AJI8_9BACT|nr:DNA-binding protein [Limnoglobus roseus]